VVTIYGNVLIFKI